MRKDRNKYLFRIGVSVLDIGRLKYKKTETSVNVTTAFTPDYYQRCLENNNAIPENTHWLDVTKASFRFLEYERFADTLYQRYLNDQGVEIDENDPGYFKVKLPTAISVQLDVKAYKRFYVNLTTFTALNQGFNKTSNSHYITNYSLTPRYESKWYTISLPVQFNQYQNFTAGLGVRVAFAYAGITNLVSAMFKDLKSLNIYIGAKFPIFQTKPRTDVDNDILYF
jgi:hypothetical protein